MSSAGSYWGAGERAADEVDFASNLALAETENYLKKKQAEMASIRLDPDFDGKTCIECGAKIQPDRVKLLKFEVVDGAFNTPPHKTDKASIRDGQKIITRHGTDKCITCQVEFARIKNIRGKQNAN